MIFMNFTMKNQIPIYTQFEKNQSYALSITLSEKCNHYNEYSKFILPSPNRMI